MLLLPYHSVPKLFKCGSFFLAYPESYLYLPMVRLGQAPTFFLFAVINLTVRS